MKLVLRHGRPLQPLRRRRPAPPGDRRRTPPLRRHPPRGGGVVRVQRLRQADRPAGVLPGDRRAGGDQPADRPVGRPRRPLAGARPHRPGVDPVPRPPQLPGGAAAVGVRRRRGLLADGAPRLAPRRADEPRRQARDRRPRGGAPDLPRRGGRPPPPRRQGRRPGRAPPRRPDGAARGAPSTRRSACSARPSGR